MAAVGTYGAMSWNARVDSSRSPFIIAVTSPAG